MVKPQKPAPATSNPVQTTGIISKKTHGTITTAVTTMNNLARVIFDLENENLRLIGQLMTPTHQILLTFRERPKRDQNSTSD